MKFAHAQQAELFLALEQDMKDFGLRSLVLVHGKNSIGDLILLLKNGRSADLYLPPEAKNARALINEISARTGVTG
ncbi:MAG: hypothetical protein IKM59_03175 [Oscillospiraceae bacterium]|nr:hypothetical protein [Oscillospiraceae bacterium]